MVNEGDRATLIGDVVHSRQARDRSRLHRRLSGVLDQVNERFDPVTPLRVTVGDEYQGVFATVAAAVSATLHLRLALLPAYDVRHGLGWGTVSVLQREPRVEDGPGWWAAREAITAVAEEARSPSGRRRRTAYRRDGGDGPGEEWVESALILRDHLVGGLSERSLAVLGQLLAGRTQREIARELEITPSAVSQRVRADGLAALLATEELLRGDRRS